MIRRYFPTIGSPFSKFIVFLQFFYLYQVFATNDMGGFAFSVVDGLSVLFSMLTLWLFFRLIGTWTSASKPLFLMANAMGLTLYGLLSAYHFGTHQMVEWSFIADNFTSAFNAESVHVIVSSFDPGGLYYIPILLLIWGLFEWRKGSVSKGRQAQPLLIKSLVITALYLGAILMPITPRDPLMAFFRSIYNYYHSDLLRGIELSPTEFPFITPSSRFLTHSVAPSDTPPHIFLIVCESLDQSVINQKTADGKEITPFLNRLQHQSVHVSRFYSNSIQTAKGHFSILFSTIPSIVGKEANQFPNIRLDSLATVLGKQGYHTTYFGAHKSKRFDDNFTFFTSHGFQDFITSKPFKRPQDEPYWNSWGPQDTLFFSYFFDAMDAQLRTSTQPQFVMLTTIYNHFPFNFLPEDQKMLYKGKTSFKQDYMNSIHLTDQGLASFFKALKQRPYYHNSIVIVVGDHGFPLGEHGNYSLPAGYHEESFRVPFFMVCPGKLKPKALSGPFSQMDIAPTIVDLLNIQGVSTNFQGTSILGPTPSITYLIQPYERQLSLIHFPYKYRFNTRLNTAYLYDLDQDPLETRNRIQTLDPNLKQEFERHIRRILLNQKAFEQDQFWPKVENKSK